MKRRIYIFEEGAFNESDSKAAVDKKVVLGWRAQATLGSTGSRNRLSKKPYVIDETI